MESFIAAANSEGQAEVALPELNLKAFDEQASYVTRRDATQTVCAVPVLTPESVRVGKISVTDMNFIDLSSISFSFQIRNNSGNPLRPLSAIPHCWFRRMRWMLNGTVLEDSGSHLNRLEEQISRFVGTNKRANYGSVGSGWETYPSDHTPGLPKEIPANSSVRVCWRPLSSGWLHAGKMCPLLGGSAGGLACELELADATDACLAHAAGSTSWSIVDLTLHCDSVSLSTAMASQFADQLLNDSILIPFQSNTMDVQFLPAGSNNMVLSLPKQYSRLNAVAVSLADEIDKAGANEKSNDSAGVQSRLMNRFYLDRTKKESVSSFMQLNNQRYPQHDVVGCKQHLIRLHKGLGIYNSTSHAACIGDDEYCGTAAADARQFLLLTDTEMVPGVHASGAPVLGGGVIQYTVKNAGEPRSAFIATNFDAVCEIRAQGCAVFT